MKPDRSLLALLCRGLFGSLLMGGAAVAETEQLVTIGDSYTIGEGVPQTDRWPDRLVDTLRERGVAISLAANPAQTGWTTADALREQLPILERAKPTVVTILIGVNDQVQGASPSEFKRSFVALLDAVQRTLASRGCNTRRILLMTIPDYSRTPTGAQFAASATAPAILRAYNAIIAAQASARGLPLVDIAPLSIESTPALTAPDGLHPSGEQYRRWLTVIEPAVTALIKTPSCHPASVPFK